MNYRNIKLDQDINAPIEFIQRHVRNFYSRDLFFWQYGHKNSNLFIAEHDGEILGTQGMIYVELKQDNNSLPSSKSETTYMSDKARGTGAFEQIYECSLNTAFKSGSKMIWGFTALGKLWTKKLGFEYVDIIYESTIFLRPSHNDRIFKKSIIKVLNLLIQLKLLFKNNYSSKVSTNIDDFNFLTDFYGDNGIYLDYSSQTFKNRTTGNPIISYQVIKFFENERPVASIIFHKHQSSFVISDVQYSKEGKLETVLSSIVQYVLNETDCFEIKFWANKSNQKYAKIFAIMKSYFAKEHLVKDMQLVYKSNSIDFKLSNLFINSIWTEGFKY